MEEVRALVLQHLRGTGARVFLFGSWARGEERAASDIDIAVDHDSPLPPGCLAELREVLEESTIPFRVDLVDLAECDPAFRSRVTEEAVEWTTSQGPVHA
ncbi:MAG: nucleotidyltransferase domain-containing protein [Firmicutes bacterium]|nr:nucleotidyltransferase domain-containing protein [Bacillota bacterium]